MPSLSGVPRLQVPARAQLRRRAPIFLARCARGRSWPPRGGAWTANYAITTKFRRCCSKFLPRFARGGLHRGRADEAVASWTRAASCSACEIDFEAHIVVDLRPTHGRARARRARARRRARQRCLAARHGRGPRHRRPGGRLRRHGRVDADQFLAARLRGLVLGAAGLRRARRRRHETRRGSSATWRLASATSRAASTAAATGTRRIRRCRRPRRPCRREAAHDDDRKTPPSRTARPRGSPGSCRGARKVCDGISTR